MRYAEREQLKCIMVFLAAFCFFMLVGITIAEKAYVMSGVCFILFIIFIIYGIKLKKRLKSGMTFKQKKKRAR